MFFYSHLYSRFGLPYLSYYCSKHLFEDSHPNKNIIRFTWHLLKNFNQGILQTLQWVGFLFWLFVSSYSGCFWMQVLPWIFMVSITFITFFWYVYNFGPKHRKWSLFDILSNPVPGVKFDGRIGKFKDFASLKWR